MRRLPRFPRRSVVRALERLRARLSSPQSGPVIAAVCIWAAAAGSASGRPWIAAIAGAALALVCWPSMDRPGQRRRKLVVAVYAALAFVTVLAQVWTAAARAPEQRELLSRAGEVLAVIESNPRVLPRPGGEGGAEEGDADEEAGAARAGEGAEDSADGGSEGRGGSRGRARAHGSALHAHGSALEVPRPSQEAQCAASARTAADGIRIAVRYPCRRDGAHRGTSQGVVSDSPDLGDTVRLRRLRVREPGPRDRGAAALVVAGEAITEGQAWFRPLRWAREHAERAFAATAGPRSGRVAAAMVYGGDPGDPQAAAAMKAAGLAHLTAVSGANCALVAAGSVLIVRLLRGSRALQGAVTLGCVGAFALLCGPDATVLRAAVMGSLAALALLHGRGRSGLCLLGAAVVLLLVWDPWLSLDLGFGLSASATMGILLWSEPFAALLGRVLPSWLAAPVAVAGSAELGCHPLLALIVPTFPGLSLPANVLVGCLVAPVTFAGISVLATAWAWPEAASVLAWMPNRAVDAILALAEFTAAHPANRSPLPVGVPGMVLGFAAWALPWTVRRWVVSRPERTWRARPPRGRRRMTLAACAAASVILVAALLLRPAPGALEGWQLALCDVGQGDAAVVRSGSRTVLIDAGPPGDAAARCLQDLGVRDLDAVLVSHLHADHRGGVPAVRRQHLGVPVYYSSLSSPEKALRLLAGDPGRVHRVDAESHPPGSVLLESEGLRVEAVLLPPRRQRASRDPGESQENRASSALLVTSRHETGTLTALFLGDLERESEAALAHALEHLARRGTAHVDVVKVPHHGARNGASTYTRLRPRAALIGVGAGNSYGHPHPSVLERLTGEGARVFRTDRNGTVTLREDGEDLVIRPSRP